MREYTRKIDSLLRYLLVCFHLNKNCYRLVFGSEIEISHQIEIGKIGFASITFTSITFADREQTKNEN